MSKTGKNSNLHRASKAKEDEFYTQLTDIENELKHYKEHFRNKTVYCNCDDPFVSNFFRFFSYNFEHLGLKKLIATCYKSRETDLFSQNDSEQAICLTYTGDKDGNGIPDIGEINVQPLKGDGDFRSNECIELLREADIVVTNPPYRRVNQGRLPKPHLRKNALFEATGDLDSFIAGAAFALKNGGAFYCIYPAERLAELFLSLKHHRLEPKTMLPLQALASKNLELVLLKATKNGKAGLKIKKPLLLYKKEGENVRLTQQALAFCPWLKCNAK